MGKLATEHHTYSFHDFRIDLDRGCLMRGQLEVKLRPKVFDVLRYLIENNNRLVPKSELIGAVWSDSFVTDDSLVQCLVELRRALGDDSQQYIRTVPRRGYIFVAEVNESVPALEMIYAVQLDAVRVVIEEEETESGTRVNLDDRSAEPAESIPEHGIVVDNEPEMEGFDQLSRQPGPRSSAPSKLNDNGEKLGRMEQEIRFCTTADGVRIAYATVGEGPPLVKAANWLNHLEFDWRSPIWRHLLEEFARDHFLVRYDERGNGLSDWNVEHFAFESFVDDLGSVVDAVGLDRFPILGISQGGPVAIAYAVRHPERVSHLVLYGAYARGWANRGESAEDIERREAQTTLTRLGWGQDNPAYLQMWTTLYIPDATPTQMHWFNDLQRASTSPENASRLLDELAKIDVVDLLSQVTVPTLVLHCRDDVVVPFEESRLLAASIPGARFVPLEGRNHLLLESEPAYAEFITEVRRFLGTGLSR